MKLPTFVFSIKGFTMPKVVFAVIIGLAIAVGIGIFLRNGLGGGAGDHFGAGTSDSKAGDECIEMVLDEQIHYNNSNYGFTEPDLGKLSTKLPSDGRKTIIFDESQRHALNADDEQDFRDFFEERGYTIKRK